MASLINFNNYEIFTYRHAKITVKKDTARGVWTWKAEFSKTDRVSGEHPESQSRAIGEALATVDRRAGIGAPKQGGGSAA